MRSLIILLAAILLFSGSTIAATCTSLGNGSWNSPSTWSCGHVPVGGDDIRIIAGHTVTISTVINIIGTGVPIIIDGDLIFDTPGAKLNLPCGSAIYVSSTGSIQSTGTEPESHVIHICRDDVWTGTDGTITGPIVIGVPLPIELTFFDAEVNGSMIDFSWQTASETNNDFFTIEGSTDGFSWNEMHRMNGAGNSQETQNYTHESSNKKYYSYFRLKQTDFNGEFTFSDLVAVDLVRDKLRIYPNPNNGSELNIELPSKESGMLQILNSDGRVAYSIKLTESRIMKLTDLNLNSGSYFVQIQQKDQVIMERLIIQ